jgi:hypothetical protein
MAFNLAWFEADFSIDEYTANVFSIHFILIMKKETMTLTYQMNARTTAR